MSLKSPVRQEEERPARRIRVAAVTAVTNTPAEEPPSPVFEIKGFNEKIVAKVAADNRVYVTFMNTDDLSTGRDTYYVVEVSPATGARVAGPFRVGLVIDGFTAA